MGPCSVAEDDDAAAAAAVAVKKAGGLYLRALDILTRNDLFNAVEISAKGVERFEVEG